MRYYPIQVVVVVYVWSVVVVVMVVVVMVGCWSSSFFVFVAEEGVTRDRYRYGRGSHARQIQVRYIPCEFYSFLDCSFKISNFLFKKRKNKKKNIIWIVVSKFQIFYLKKEKIKIQILKEIFSRKKNAAYLYIYI